MFWFESHIYCLETQLIVLKSQLIFLKRQLPAWFPATITWHKALPSREKLAFQLDQRGPLQAVALEPDGPPPASELAWGQISPLPCPFVHICNVSCSAVRGIYRRVLESRWVRYAEPEKAYSERRCEGHLCNAGQAS